MSRLGLSVLILSLVIHAVCQGQRGGAETNRADSADVELVSWNGEDIPLSWTFTTLFALGGEESGPSSFFRVTRHNVGSDSAGNLYVLDGQEYRVVTYDPSGEFVRTMGAEGGGPGELRRPTALWVSPDGIASVYDFGKNAVVRFASDGEILPQVPLTKPLAGVRDARYFAVAPGGVVATTYDWSSTAGEIVGYNLTISAGDETTVLARVSHMGGKMVMYRCGGLNQPPIFAPKISWDLCGTSMAVNQSSEYAIDVYREESLVRKVRRALSPRTATRDLALAELGEGVRVDFGRGPCLIRADELVDGRGFADHIPTISGIKLSPDGHLWVQRTAVGVEYGPIDIYAPDGSYVGTLPSGTPFPLLLLPNARIGVVVKDEFDIERLVIQQIEP